MQKSPWLLAALAALAFPGCKKPAADRPLMQHSQPPPSLAPIPQAPNPPVAPADSPAPTDPAALADRAAEDRLRQLVIRFHMAGDPERRSDLSDEIFDMADEGVPALEVARVIGGLLQNDPDTDVKMALLDHLSDIDNPDAPLEILRAITPQMPKEVRLAAIEMLGDSEDKRVLPQLQQAAADGDAEIAKAARDAVEALNEPAQP